MCFHRKSSYQHEEWLGNQHQENVKEVIEYIHISFRKPLENKDLRMPYPLKHLKIKP